MTSESERAEQEHASASGSHETMPDPPIQILLADVPAPAPRRSMDSVTAVQYQAEPFIPAIPQATAIEEDEDAPSRWRDVKRVVARGFFDPFQAFEDRVDWGRFSRAQVFLTLTSLVGPLLFLLVTGFLGAVLYHAGATLNSVTPPNPFYELALYPFVFVLAKGYWMAYLALPIAVLIVGWLWAAITAWNLARDSEADFTKMFCILAMLGSMMAPFTLFPFFRLVALAVLIWYTAKRMNAYFDVSFVHLVKRGGIFLLGFTVAYTWFERKVEAYYPAASELASNLNGYYFNKRKLEWPSFRVKVLPSPNQILWEKLGSLDPEVREKATAKALDILKNSQETPEMRFKLATRLAELGNTAGMVFSSRAYQSGQGAALDYPQALYWIRKAIAADPKQIEYGLNEANLLFLNKQILDGKRRFVALAKDNIDSLDKISEYVKKAGYGSPVNTLAWEIQNMYRQSSSANYIPSDYSYSHTGYNRFGETSSLRDSLLQRLSLLDRDGTQWFYRALITEYGSSTSASPDVYGESSAEYKAEELQNKIGMNDPVALDTAGDISLEKGDITKARDYWLRAALALNSDARRPNARYYLKLAESYDSEVGSNRTANARESIRFYLAYLFLTDHSGSSNNKTITALKRLGAPINQDVDVSGFQYLALCTKYDVPEAWATMGSYYMGGHLAGVQKNLAKARDCFQKARSLGYQGPVVHLLDGVGDKAVPN